MGQYFKF